MIKYLVRENCEYSTCTRIVSSKLHHYYYGKSSNPLSHNILPPTSCIAVYGYDTKQAAEERMTALQRATDKEKSYGYWNISFDVVGVEV